MKKAFKALVAGAFLMSANAAWATPSTTFWTPATTYVQPFGIPHLTYDTYFGEKGAYPIDVGLTMGILPFEKVQAEIGFDLFYPGYTANGFYLNAKLGLTEGALGSWFPGISAGIHGVGLKSGTSDYNILHAEVGKALPIGTIVVGGYYGAGSEALWTGSDGSVNRLGLLGACGTSLNLT